MLVSEKDKREFNGYGLWGIIIVGENDRRLFFSIRL